ncbi:MAG TPA: FAD-dependent oxidoreductase, partial [Microbacteriaceae bacterium]|nr:FAD-dependent oxidoreductase [Microbacteriaceae bacterium]
VRALRVAETEYVDGRRVPKGGTEREIPADLVLIAMGFTGPERHNLETQLGVRFTSSGLIERDDHYAATEPSVYAAGDAGRGQSLIVWAIAEGRAAAARVDAFLMGESALPVPVGPRDIAIGLHPA